MPKFSFIFHRDVYLRHVIEAATYQEAEELALEADDRDGVTFSTPFLLQHSKRLVEGPSEQTKEIGQA